MKRTNLFIITLFVVAFGGISEAEFIIEAPVALDFGGGSANLSADGLTFYGAAVGSMAPYPGVVGSTDILIATRSSKQASFSVGNVRYLDPPINTSSDDRDPCISKDDCTLYLSSTRSGGSGSHDLWMATRETVDGPWSTPVNLGTTVNSTYSETGPEISADGCTLYFTSNRPGSSGNDDIWMTTRQSVNDPWQEPVNLGPVVNSASNDLAPCLFSDDMTMIFLSDRPGGYGGRDIWLTTRLAQDMPWTEPTNMGAIINSSYNDVDPEISADGAELYFMSLRPPQYYYFITKIQRTIDFDENGTVDFMDFATVAKDWLKQSSLADVGPLPFGDGKVDVQDLRALAAYWLKDLRLIAHWKFDETHGAIASDCVGGYDGTLQGNPGWKPEDGWLAGALEFDGSGDYVLVDCILNPRSGPFSAYAWIKSDQPGRAILSQTNGSGLGATWLGTSLSNGKLRTDLMYNEMESTTVVTDNQWHHVGIVWDGKRRSLYVDDVEVAKDTTDRSAVYATGSMNIGADKDLTPGSFWEGLIDDLKIYDDVVRP